jgi:hypothetical protein
MFGHCPVCAGRVTHLEATLIDGGQSRDDGMKEAVVRLLPCGHEALAVFPDSQLSPTYDVTLLER